MDPIDIIPSVQIAGSYHVDDGKADFISPYKGLAAGLNFRVMIHFYSEEYYNKTKEDGIGHLELFDIVENTTSRNLKDVQRYPGNLTDYQVLEMIRLARCYATETKLHMVEMVQPTPFHQQAKTMIMLVGNPDTLAGYDPVCIEVISNEKLSGIMKMMIDKVFYREGTPVGHVKLKITLRIPAKEPTKASHIFHIPTLIKKYQIMSRGKKEREKPEMDEGDKGIIKRIKNAISKP